MKQIILILLAISSITCFAQVGINTTEPKGTLDVTSVNNTGLVLPRVTSVEDVTDGNGNAPVDGTTVYDLSRNTTCFYQNGDWVCIDTDASGDPILTDPTASFDNNTTIDYIKASNTDSGDQFGWSTSLSSDGNTLAVGSKFESSNGVQNDNSENASGAVYVFTLSGGAWSQQAYLKASNLDDADHFGNAVSLSEDGNTLAVAAEYESQGGNISASGAVYIFTRSGTTWTEETYVKASNPGNGDRFGFTIALSGDGLTLAVGAYQEDSDATGVNGDGSNNNALNSGAAYIFKNTTGVWNQEAYIKASNTDVYDYFGYAVSLSHDGNTLAVGAYREQSNATGVNGNQADNSENFAGAVYIFTRNVSMWTQHSYVKASNTEEGDSFGGALSLSAVGDILAVGASYEDSNGSEGDNSIPNSGAVYVFTNSGGSWMQAAYLKASNLGGNDLFGFSVAMSDIGNKLLVGARTEESAAVGINGNENDNSVAQAGAAYVFKKEGGVWNQEAYVKAKNTGVGDNFGYFVSISSDGNTMTVGASFEDSNATGINGDQTDNSANNAGAVYVYTAE